MDRPTLRRQLTLLSGMSLRTVIRVIPAKTNRPAISDRANERYEADPFPFQPFHHRLILIPFLFFSHADQDRPDHPAVEGVICHSGDRHLIST